MRFDPERKKSIRKKSTKLNLALCLFTLLILGSGCLDRTASIEPDLRQPAGAQNGMVSTQEAIATQVGLDILKKGGNAVDAAVAVGFALAVTHPGAGNLGGGGFMLIHSAKTGETVAIDYRETAPSASTPDMYLDQKGQVDQRKSQFSYHSVGVPGTVAGLTRALKKYGTLALDEVIAPAIHFAEEGLVISQSLSEDLAKHQKALRKWTESRKIFFTSSEELFKAGDILVQKDLAWSLKQIQKMGADAFYRGPIADKLVDNMKSEGGLISHEDLQNYRAIIRKPVRGTYKGFEIVSMPPPSSGGIHLIQILNILEGYPIASLGHNTPETIHLMAEAMKLAYADRSQHLGDPDFWKVPLTGLTSKSYAKKLRTAINPDHARPSTEISFGNPIIFEESHETTHFSVMDKAGNVVSNTYTLNFSFGSGIVAKGTGIILNNEMDDFSSKPGVPNAYGLIGGKANAIQSRKRPLSSMSPTIVFKEGKPYLATGSLGGSHIISTTLQIVLNVVDHKKDIEPATKAPRVHHQWLPDELRIEEGIVEETVRLLSDKGQNVKIKEPMGSAQSILKTSAGFSGASDPRRPGALTLGY
jgi:gamma-glutamyltranspeptidase/glutathione hydrolase